MYVVESSCNKFYGIFYNNYDMTTEDLCVYIYVYISNNLTFYMATT